MATSKLVLRLAPVAAITVLLMAAGGASADIPRGSDGLGATDRPFTVRGEGLVSPLSDAVGGRSAFSPFGHAQHGSSVGHLPPAAQNMELVGKLEPTRQFGDIVPGQIADLAVYKEFAYLNSWQEPTCSRGGVYVADISNPAAPQEAAFEPALAGNFHGEGAQVITFDAPSFKGDVLAVNNEICNEEATAGGGFDLYDVSNPRDPQPLVQGFGDFGGVGDLGTPGGLANDAHSVFMWQDRGKVYIVTADDLESTATDVDIFDITNPRAPVPVGEFDFDARFPQVRDQSAYGDSMFLHDMVVKRMGDRQIMLADYWDAGYLTVDVTNPADPQYVGDTSFDGSDPLVPGVAPPEGNAHQGELSADSRFLLAADEDFAPFRGRLRITTGGNAGQDFPAGLPIDDSAKIFELPDRELGPDVRFAGRACDVDGPLPAPPADDGRESTERIAALERGLCTFEEKADNAEAAGYDGYVIFNNADRPDGDPLVTNGVLDDTPLPGVFIQRSTAERIFGGAIPAPGTDGSDVSVVPQFDGWGYAHLYENSGGKMRQVDAFAIDEGIDERYASGFGDLSIHEFATDPEVNLAYASYYAGGMRVLRFGADGLDETGRFIDEGGNNFWGVEQFTLANGERLIAGSDRDFGLYLFRYTGPGAVGPRAPQPQPEGPKPGRCTNLLKASASGGSLSGSAFGDQITGSEADDVINALAGDDCVDGLGGNDDLRGGAGVDTIDGQRGNDRIRGDAGRGNLRGGRGNDRLRGGSRRDVLFGNTGRDRLSGGRGNDQLFGGAGRDVLIGGRGRDIIEGGTGRDRIFARDGKADRIDCGFGRDTVVSRDRKDKLTSCERKARIKRNRR